MGKAAVTRTIIIGTRASKLALAQTEIVRSALLKLKHDLDVQVEHIVTKGDLVLDRPLSEIGGNGLFVTQIESALRAGSIDLAVHSAKDLPSALPADMVLAAFLPRADARDVLVSRDGVMLAELPEHARVGTSSPRRTCLLRALRPDLTLLDIRGNVDTRLRKLREGEYDAIVLAAAGLQRLGLLDCVTEWLDPHSFIPAVAQGALVVEARADDAFMVELAGALNDAGTSTVVRAERAFLARLGGTCSLPVGAYASLKDGSLHIWGMVGTDDCTIILGEHTGQETAPEEAGITLAEALLARPQLAKQAVVGRPSSSVRPLQGRKIVVTRPQEQSAGLVARLRELGATPIECPAISIAPLRDPAPLDAAISHLETYDWVIFTSVNGVTHFTGRMAALGKEISVLCERKLGAIGPATHSALQKLGCSPDFMPETYIAEAIVEQIGDLTGTRVLLPRADIARQALARGLSALGADVDEVPAYHTVHSEATGVLIDALGRDEVDAITFTSSSTVRYTIDGMLDAGLNRAEALELMNRAAIVCIGPITAGTARECGLTVTATSNEYIVDGVVDTLVKLYATQPQKED
jgi:hydroxymethylbilane synthase